MATVDFFTGFTYKWAQTGNTFAWDDAQYKLGWATVGDTPPTVEQFNRVHQVADEKSNWLYGQLASAAAAKGITLSAGDLDSLKDILEAFTPAASETVAGIAEIATQAEVTTGTDDARIITPLKLATAIPAASTTAVGRLRIATTAEAQAGALDTVAITPLKLVQSYAVGQVLAANINQRLPSGLILKAGLYQSSVPSSAAFPTPFPNACIAVVGAESAVTPGAPDFIVVQFASISASGFNPQFRTQAGVFPSAATVRYFAIGY